MSQNESKMISEREAVLRERKAAARAIRELAERARHTLASVLPWDWHGIDAFAEELYPLPKVTRQRIVTDSRGYQWRAHDGQVEWKNIGARIPREEWRNPSDWTFTVEITAERLRIWNDLLANPTEVISEVDADA